MEYKKIFKLGLKDGVETTWELAKVIVPVYFVITFLKYTPFIDWLVSFFQPVTLLLGLPGEAAMPIVIANALTVYPAIPAITSFPFTSKEITIIGTMILICHSLPVETMIAKKSGSSGSKIVLIRITMAIVAGLILNLTLGG
ncbi:MAG: nucleoside recognition domain-containing protein [Bacillota bacterium]